MKKIQTSLLATILFCCLSFGLYAQDEPETPQANDQLFELSLEELMSIEVVTASNKAEKLNKAPATIIVISEEEIQERGYLELFDVLNDLPGFDLSRAFGDDNYYAYMRGYRKTTSDQMLLMIDGIIMNHLYNNNMNAFAQYPLNGIKQIEIVYGPASAIYGPNAFSGVINMITKKDGKSGILLSTGQNNTNIVDLHISQKGEDLTFNLGGRLYQTDGHDFNGRTPLLEESNFTNPYYWGDFAQTNFIGNKSPIGSNFIHPNLSYKGLTVGLINFFYESGLGTEFAAGTTLNAGTWQFKENTIYARYEANVGNLSSKTLLKYRRSDIPGSSTFLWRWLTEGADTVTLQPGEQFLPNGPDHEAVTNDGASAQTYVVDINYQYADYWQSTNASYSLFQDFTYSAGDYLTVNFGLKYDRRILNRDYVINSTEVARSYVYDVANTEREGDPINSAILGAFPFPARPDDASMDQENHNVVTDRGAYAQVQYAPSSLLTIFGGLRYDYNSVWKGVLSPRVGVVVEPASGFIAKAFFGTAFLEPSARILYGGWSGSLSNDKLVPEKMRTVELSAAYTKGMYSFGFNGFYNTAPDAIGSSGGVPVNLGERRMMGAELNAKMLLRSQGSVFNKFRGDLYLSYIKSEEDLAGTGDFVETGNMAPIKLRFILTAYAFNNLSISLQNRYISKANTVDTNPLGAIDAYFVSDAFIQYNNLLVPGLSLGVKVYNWMNVDYFHAGYRNADAGETSVNNALFNTSWYNSRLPQPERTVLFTLSYRI